MNININKGKTMNLVIMKKNILLAKLIENKSHIIKIIVA